MKKHINYIDFKEKEIESQYFDRHEDAPAEEPKEKNHEARRAVIRITNMAYMVNKRGEYTVACCLSKYSIECNVVKTKDLGVKTLTRICANIDNMAELNSLIDLLEKYHGHNYQ